MIDHEKNISRDDHTKINGDAVDSDETISIGDDNVDYHRQPPLYDDNRDNRNILRENHNNDNNRRTNNLVPGVERIPGINSNNNNNNNNNNDYNYNGRGIFSLPHAYPVPNNTNISYISSSSPLNEAGDDITNNNRNNDDALLEDKKDRKACFKFNYMNGFMTFFGILILLNIALYVFKFSSPLSSKQQTTGTSTTSSTNHTENKTTTEEAPIKNNDDETQKDTFDFTIMEEIRKKTNIDSSKQNEYNYTCYTDPMEIQLIEWDYYERGEDLSQNRTYIICPHTFMDIFGYRLSIFEIDHGTGEVHPLILFLPNVHVKCGLDGSSSNNCTFSGSQIQLMVDDMPFPFINYKLPDSIKQENITIEGFTFTQGSNGLNVLIQARNGSFTLRNCLFVNNNRMFASIRSTSWSVVDNRAIIENCTFVNNTYQNNPIVAATFNGWLPTIAVIMVYALDPYWEPSKRNPNDPDTMIVGLSVSNCVFHNNVFLSKSDTVVAAVINVLPPFTSLSVTDSCFVDNEGYSSGVISISEGDTYIYTSPEPSTQFYSGNHFIGNMPKEDHKSSCILSRQYIRFGSDGIPERSELEEECEEYDDTTILSTDMCLL